MNELRAITERLRRLELEDLVSISQATDGAIPPELIAVVEGPQEVDYEEHANPKMLLWMEELREGRDLTPHEKKVVRMAQKEITRRIMKRSRTGTRKTRADKQGGKRKIRRGGKKNRKSRCTRRR